MIRRLFTHAGPTDRVAGAHAGRLLVIEDNDGQTYLITDPLRAIGRELFGELLEDTPLDVTLLEEAQPAGYGGQRQDLGLGRIRQEHLAIPATQSLRRTIEPGPARADLAGGQDDPLGAEALSPHRGRSPLLITKGGI